MRLTEAASTDSVDLAQGVINDVVGEFLDFREATRENVYLPGQFGAGAMCYAHLASYTLAFQAQKPGYVIDTPTYRLTPMPDHWLMDRRGWQPKNPRRDLVRAAAFILAELERLDATLAANKPAAAA